MYYICNEQIYFIMNKLIYLIILLSFFTACSKEKKTNKAAEKMQEFVINISKAAKMHNPHFIVIPQNGIELCYGQADIANGMNFQYTNAIDGVGMEELLYKGYKEAIDERLDMTRDVYKNYKSILVSDYTETETNYTNSVQINEAEGFICYPRRGNNYDYAYIQPIPNGENADDITALHMAKNYLYLISDNQFSSKSAFLDSIKNTNYDVVIIDLFFKGNQLSYGDVESLKTKKNGAKRLVISYMNIGSAEKYRYYWKDTWKVHKPAWLKKEYDGYPDEIWVEFWKSEWQEIIYNNSDSYLKRVLKSGFDGVYLDNVEAYYFLYNE